MADTEEKTSVAKPPVYILGNTPLGQYLAAKFILKGENAVIIASRQNCPTEIEISLREEHSLKKQKFSIPCRHYSSEKAKMLIITSPNNRLKSELMLLSAAHFSAAPIIVFSMLSDFRIIESLLKHNTIRAGFDGWLQTKDNQIFILGGEPQVTLSKPFNTLEYSLKALSYFHGAEILCQTCEDKNQVFWQAFAGYAVSALASAHYRQSIFNILKNKDKQNLINTAVNEICSLAAAENISLTSEEILKKIYNTPINYTYGTQTPSDSTGRELYNIHGIITNTARRHNIAVPALKQLHPQDISV